MAVSTIKCDSTSWQNLKDGGIKYRKGGAICFVYFNLAIPLSTSHTWVTDMPSGFRPAYNVYLRLNGGGGNGFVNVSFSTAGGISAWVDSGTNTAINGWAIYPTT